MSWISNLWKKITGAFTKVDFKQILQVVFTSAVKVVLGQVWETAQRITTEVGKEEITNEEKRSKAFGQIKDIAKGEGLELRDSLINLLIEVVVSYSKTIKF